jgi:hypothetical protein
MSQAAAQVPRNAPCPCGSGKKFKHCCGNKPAAAAPSSAPAKAKRDLWLIWLGVALVAAGTIFALVSVNRRPTQAPVTDVNAVPFNGTPKAWEFDAPNNRHWDPAHGHWHVGPPPPPEARK